MFERINIDDLFLAQISVKYPIKDYHEFFEDILFDETCGHGYITVLKKEGNKYIDLNNPRLLIPKIDPTQNSYTIELIEPLSNYYNKKKYFTKKEAINTAKIFFDIFNRKRFLNNLINEDNVIVFSKNAFKYNERIETTINKISTSLRVCDKRINKYDEKVDFYDYLECLETIPVIRDIPSFTLLCGIVGFISAKKGIPLYGYPIEIIACGAMSEILTRYKILINIIGGSFFEIAFSPLSYHYEKKADSLKRYKEDLLRTKEKIEVFQKELAEMKNAIVPAKYLLEEKLINIEIECANIPEKLNERELLKEQTKKLDFIK